MPDKLEKSSFGTRMIPYCQLCTDNVEQCDGCFVIFNITDELFCFDFGKGHFCSESCYENHMIKISMKKKIVESSGVVA